MNDIEIKIVGMSGSGKSAIAELIRQALVANGLKVSLNDDNGNGTVDERPGVIAWSLVDRLKALAGRNAKVTVQTISARPKPCG